MIEDLRKKYVTMERDSEFQSRRDRLLGYGDQGNLIPTTLKFTATGETRGIAVIGGAGSGKTSLLHHAISKHSALQPSQVASRPCVSISIPNPATMKSIGLEILNATGYPELAKKRTAWGIWNAVRTRFQVLGTTVLLIDEAHDLFPHRSKSEAPEILKTLKSLMQGPGAVIVILSGIESLWDSILFDDQLDRRHTKFELPLIETAADGKVVWGVLRYFCNCVGIALAEQDDLVERLVHASRRRLGLCIEQTISAIEIALTRGDASLDAQHFADAFFRQDGCTVADNVFLVQRWSSIDLGARRASRAA